MFNIIQAQQEKKNELEQIKYETEYQHEYYRHALQQKEELPNIRHDMRNRLQMVQVMIRKGDFKDKSQAFTMLEEMKIKINS